MLSLVFITCSYAACPVAVDKPMEPEKDKDHHPEPSASKKQHEQSDDDDAANAG